MAFIVRRPAGRWEIRESYSTAEGPRARTLVTFKSLSPHVIERAVRTANSPVDRGGLIRAAKRIGVPVEQPEGDALAQSLLRSLARGERVRPGLRKLLIERLGGTPKQQIDESVADWIGASPKDRGAALVDLLGLVDRLPKPRRTPLRFPGFRPAG